MTQKHPKPWLWLTVAVCGLLALAACGEPAQVSEPSEARATPAKAAPTAASETAASAEPTAAPGTPKTVRGPKVTAPVEEVPFQGKRIAIVHTANVIGELEPCG